jgi:hypothetical protein
VQHSPTVSERLIPHLKRCGYDGARLATEFPFDDFVVDVVAFAGKPWDNWSACLAAVRLNGDSEASAAMVASLGVTSVFVCGSQGIDWWRIGAKGPTIREPVKWNQLEGFFREHKAELDPRAIYDAKLHRPSTKSAKLTFFDVGLMPAVEKERGETLLRVVRREIDEFHDDLGDRIKSERDWEHVYRAVFWLLTAKVLNDKKVPNFINVELGNVKDVFDRIGRHHGVTDSLPPFGAKGLAAMGRVAERLGQMGALADVSSESIAYLYEHALIDKAAHEGKTDPNAEPLSVRKRRGIHGTPSVLRDHILSQLWPLIEDIRPADRIVLEPACGHAPFLTGMLRWLRDWDESGEPKRTHVFHRDRMVGLDNYAFARELAKLNLTIADAEHRNSWTIREGDMFAPGVLRRYANAASILLSNPPYEPFAKVGANRYEDTKEPVRAKTQGVEMLNRTLKYLPDGGVFGVVMPVGVLHDNESKPVREELLRDFDLSEISVFADNLFVHGDHEVAVLMGRKKKPRSKPPALMYRRVREAGMAAFKERLAFSWEREVLQSRFAYTPDHNLWLPDLVEMWDYLASSPRLDQMVRVQQGRQYWQEDKLTDRGLLSRHHREGFVEAVLRADVPYSIYDTLRGVLVDPGRASFRTQGGGAAPGSPQVLVGYAPVSREQWRLKAVVDDIGVAASSRWVTFRPFKEGPSRLVLWAVLNSPVANAYVYCYSGKRETLVGEWNEFPFPVLSNDQRQLVEAAAARYRALAIAKAKAKPTPTDLFTPSRPATGPVPAAAEVQAALLAMDAAVLRAYDLPPRLERQLLDLFTGVERKGVGLDGPDGKSTFRGYYPPGFTAYVPLNELISESFAASTAGRLARGIVPVRSKAADESLALADALARGA